MSPKQGVDRRKFLVAGAGCAAAAGIGYLTKDLWYPLTQKTTAPEAASPTQTQTPTNSPPYANFELARLRYIQPCVGQDVLLRSTSRDADGDPLIHKLYVNEEEVLKTEPIDMRTAGYFDLPPIKFKEVGTNRVKLEVSDGKLKAEMESSVLVEPDQLFPLKSLSAKFKGVNYCAGDVAEAGWNMPTPTKEEMEDHLHIIHDDLGCNAIIITAGAPYYEDNIIKCAEMAVKIFDRVELQPRYFNSTPDETVERIGKFAPRVRELRKKYANVVYNVGHEFGLETAIISGNTWDQRVVNAFKGEWLKVRAVLPSMFNRIIKVCKENYGYGITYAATPWEANESLVPWSDSAFESIGVNAYIHDFLGWDEAWFLGLFSRLSVNMKPIHSFDWGMMSFAGADKFGGWNPLNIGQNPYDEEPQARYCERTMKMLNSARIDGSFWVMYNDTFDRGHGLYNPQTKKRKKGFYMYKSFQRVGS